jgi:uncharacterized damage-inducible protein DinB
MAGLVAGRTQAAPAKGAVQAELIAEIDQLGKQILSLEEAIPQEKFNWRPAPGVRSVGEVYLHIAFGNYNMGRMAFGKSPPEATGFTQDRKKWETQTTDKAAIKKIVAASFEWTKDMIKGMPDKDLDKKVDFFGHEISTRAVLLDLMGHESEHLGQSIAYARSNNVTPPWSKNQ